MIKSLPFILLISIASMLFAQEKKTGPIIKDFGQVWAIENPDYQIQNEQLTKEQKKAVHNHWCRTFAFRSWCTSSFDAYRRGTG